MMTTQILPNLVILYSSMLYNMNNNIQQDLHDFNMLFHTTLRNIGLYTTLSYASLAYSRVYRTSTPFYDILLIIVSITFIIIATTLNLFLYYDTSSFFHKLQSPTHLFNISYAVFGIHTILFILALITLLRSIF